MSHTPKNKSFKTSKRAKFETARDNGVFSALLLLFPKYLHFYRMYGERARKEYLGVVLDLEKGNRGIVKPGQSPDTVKPL